jgi:allantoin racemase
MGLSINCFGDPGLDASPEVVSIPVVGPCEASMHLAAMLGHEFSVVTVLEHLIPELQLHAQKYGVGWKLASARSVDLPVLDLEEGREQFVGRMVGGCQRGRRSRHRVGVYGLGRSG